MFFWNAKQQHRPQDASLAARRRYEVRCALQRVINTANKAEVESSGSDDLESTDARDLVLARSVVQAQRLAAHAVSNAYRAGFSLAELESRLIPQVLRDAVAGSLARLAIEQLLTHAREICGETTRMAHPTATS